ncbi:3-(3-hydroxyphenyl)propionate hydroxylase [Nocardia yunnanensis]|uniref:3-(3-hydroxyphenyl)propionate hydroxylase n=1 Tax=Nocardia yunnanensis TaxID=2382165 RepID=A0A386ZBP3_9NOCA|nr:FAD-dependent monooxygenase [Nocardia yunnanensis]AYF74514.1 3-(3-hydroxyphenyl)propionate hydroxylase [Nocardia yunnanensis]
MKTQVLVAGAGPTGLTLAIDLARRGLGVRIVEQATEFFTGSRGDGIQPRTLEVFEDLGVLDAVLAQGMPQAPLLIHVDGQFVTERRMSQWREPTAAVPHPNPWVLAQADTERVLRERLAEFGVRVELGTALVGFDGDADGVTAILEHAGVRERVRVEYLVGADGGRSTVRKALGIAFEGSTDESIRMLLGDVRADALDHAVGYWFAESSAPMDGIALMPLPGGRTFQFMTGLDADSGTDLAVLQDYVTRRSRRDDIVLSELTWSTVWRPNVRLAQRYRVGRVFLAGDAAHVHPPTGGQGLNTGVQDAYNLGWKLEVALRDPGADSEALLDTYETERRTTAARVLGLSSELLDRTVKGDPDAMDREGTHQLDISYRTEPGDGVQVGDRAPDAPLEDANGKTVRLFELCAGPRATLLLFGPDDRDPVASNAAATKVVRIGTAATGPGMGEFADSAGHARRAYQASENTRVLIRPDGYVGFISR